MIDGRVPPFTIMITGQEATRIVEVLEGTHLGGGFTDRNIAEFVRASYQNAKDAEYERANPNRLVQRDDSKVRRTDEAGG